MQYDAIPIHFYYDRFEFIITVTFMIISRDQLSRKQYFKRMKISLFQIFKSLIEFHFK